MGGRRRRADGGLPELLAQDLRGRGAGCVVLAVPGPGGQRQRAEGRLRRRHARRHQPADLHHPRWAIVHHHRAVRS
ncbi:hypothetical protein G6F22_021938 [Rhizopus arrhizus]|nr:hypothetical protein G6F22_021938 [Rhizopus arrhizus]